ncbi:MAG TPA: HAMP domain-containing sensor histidine kinase [Nitrososphaerales archaeon]|nr:HAMP domain-containing sensor histidine kinase [Nitrososphaerales archaeon]
MKGTAQAEEALSIFMSRAKEEIDICSDKLGIGAMVNSGALKRGLTNGKKEGVRVRYLTDITPENSVYSKELAKMVELRHLDGVTGNFAISDAKEYVGPLVTDANTLGQLIFSNAKPLFEQHRYLFDTLWKRATPAEERLAELAGGAPAGQTRLVGGDERFEALRKVLDTSDRLMGCTTVGALKTFLDNLPEELLEVAEKNKSEQGGVRWVTSIGNEDAAVVSKCLRMGIQIRHTSRLPPLSFECSTNALVASIQKEGQGLETQNVLLSTEPAYVTHFRLVFEEIWKNGVDGKKRLDEIQKGLESSNVEIIQNAHESMKTAWQMAKSAKEILMLFSTPQAFIRQVNSDGVDKMREALGNTQTKVKLLVPEDESILAMLEGVRESLPKVEIRLMNKSLKTKISILIIDRSKTMVFETKDDSREDLYESLGITAFTESKSLGESFAVIFDGIWKQTELYEQLEMHDRMQRDFVNIAAHELRTPVQAIINYAELAKNYQEDREEYYRKLLKSVLRLHKITEDILDAARIESKTLHLSKEVFVLNEVLKSAMDEQKQAAAKKHLDLHLEQPEPVYIFGDKTRISQVMANLLINAVKFTEEGSVTVTANLDKRAGKVAIRVTDTGIGIDKSLMPHLFARFMAKSQSGTGLGLFISKNIIEEHGGRIWVEKSEVGKGSTFSFELPVSTTIEARSRTPVAPPQPVEAGLTEAATDWLVQG